MHELRHTAITLAVSSGVDPKTAQGLLGHARFSTTMQIYAHYSGEQERAGVRKVDELLDSEGEA
jgi:integrase